MKIIILSVLFLLSTISFALPCPNGGGPIYKGDSIQEVIKQCGQPDEKNVRQRTIYTEKQWIYYRPHAFDQGSTQIVITFRNDFVSLIHINERYPYFICQQNAIALGLVTTIQTSCGDWSYNTGYTGLCGYGVGVGDSMQLVLANCGTPAKQSTLADQTMEVTELVYGGANAQTIVFQNGKLMDWE